MSRHITVLSIALLFTSSSAWADQVGTTTVREANDAIRALLRNKATAGSKEEAALARRVTREVRGFLDVDELGRRALRDHWSTLPKKQRTEFSGLLRALIEDSYIRGLRANLDYVVSYTGEASGENEERLVKTIIRAKRRGRPHTIDIEYRLRREGSRWRAFDVVTDGVGLVENYRAQFNKLIARDGFEGLLKRMRKRRGKSS